MSTEKKGPATNPDNRKMRLAAELRANLLKRKAQARQRRSAGKPAQPADGKD
ncbi:MAG: hypothetical protein M9924_03055 [Rhizobiaceae bacterium]|nr:hypothetical protein [Rhizobiaceae bacterium]